MDTQKQELINALRGLLVAIDCGKHEKKLEKSNPLCVRFARKVLNKNRS